MRGGCVRGGCGGALRGAPPGAGAGEVYAAGRGTGTVQDEGGRDDRFTDGQRRAAPRRPSARGDGWAYAGRHPACPGGHPAGEQARGVGGGEPGGGGGGDPPPPRRPVPSRAAPAPSSPRTMKSLRSEARGASSVTTP